MAVLVAAGVVGVNMMAPVPVHIAVMSANVLVAAQLTSVMPMRVMVVVIESESRTGNGQHDRAGRGEKQ